MKNPFLVIETTQEGVTIEGIIYKKMLFKLRPKPKGIVKPS